MNITCASLDESYIPVDQGLVMTVRVWDYQFALTLSVQDI